MATDKGSPIKLVLLTNIIAPYRVPIYNALAKRFSLHLLYSGQEDNRREWAGTERQLRGVEVKRSAGVSFKYFAARSGKAYDDRYLHVNPGYLVDLIKQRPDAVISVELGFRTLCAQVYCAIARVPLLIWWEGSIVTERDIGVVRKGLRALIAPHADGWLSGGLNATKYLRTLGVPQARIVHAQNCVDERQFASTSPPAQTFGPRPVILVVGRLVPSKGVGLLLDVVATLRAEGRTFSVVIVGDGPERERLQRKVQALGLDNIAFHLARPPQDMPAYYRGADMLVLPTLHDVWGLVVNEALWAGLPVLASKYAGCADELLPPDQIFDPLDSDDFSAKLRHAIEVGLPTADTSPMKTVQQVADAIGASVEHLVQHPRERGRRHGRVRRSVQGLVRSAHVRLLDRGLPERVAIYLHNLDAQDYAPFAEMISYFRGHAYVVTGGPGEFLSSASPAKRLFISFDDNFQAWHRALPLFERLRIKVTFYVNTLPLRDRIGASQITEYFERIGQPRDTRPLSQGELRDLAAAGHTLGSHTHSHRMLTTLPLDGAQEEIRRGRAELEHIIGQPARHFAYPFGMVRHFSERLRDYCKCSGFQTVASAIPGLLHIPQEPLGINRTGWNVKRPLSHNLQNIRVDGACFARLTGRSAVGSVFSSGEGLHP